MEQHRKNPACNSCHRVIDPLGLALENYDVTGRWRNFDRGVPVDPKGELYDGTKVDGPDGLSQLLGIQEAQQPPRLLAVAQRFGGQHQLALVAVGGDRDPIGGGERVQRRTGGLHDRIQTAFLRHGRPALHQEGDVQRQPVGIAAGGQQLD